MKAEGDDIRSPVHHLFVTVEPELDQQLREAADKAGCTGAASLRHLLREVTPADFPVSWERGAQHVPTTHPSGRRARRSDDSRDYDQRLLIRPDAASRTKRQQPAEVFRTSRAEIIRQLIAQTTPGDFPQRWQLAVAERRQGVVTDAPSCGKPEHHLYHGSGGRHGSHGTHPRTAHAPRRRRP